MRATCRSGVDDTSFIPHAIRAAYGLTTVDNKVAVYSYYFHSMLQRASDVTIAYNTSTEAHQLGRDEPIYAPAHGGNA